MCACTCTCMYAYVNKYVHVYIVNVDPNGKVSTVERVLHAIANCNIAHD